LTEPASLPELLRHFESLGNNCEFGIVQRATGYDPPGLFRNVGFLQTEQIIHAIENALDGMFEEGMYEFSRPPNWPDYALHCRRYGFQFHTAVPVDAGEETVRDVILRFRFLKRLFLEDLESARKVFAYRHNEAVQTERTLADRLLAALRRHGSNWLLFVVQDERPEHRFAYARAAGDGLIMAGIPRLSAENPPIINFAAWEKLTRATLDIRSATRRRDDGPMALHSAAAQGDGLLFEIACEGLKPQSGLTVEAEVNIPANYDGSAVNLVAWGFESVRMRVPDVNQRDTWQTVSVSACIPPDGDRAVVMLRNDGGTGQISVPSRRWKLRIEEPV
jgi:hypothetical protein